MPETLVVNEIYLSLQGESTFAGLPCVFIRLTGCDLRCSYCDSAYAFSAGQKMEIPEIQSRVHDLANPYNNGSRDSMLPIIEVTGGEPLLQKDCLLLMKLLCDEGFTVLIETSGVHDLSRIDPRVHRIMDIKCPSSGECLRNRWENLEQLKSLDEVKFVVGTNEDYEWAKELIFKRGLDTQCEILFSWVSPLSLSQKEATLKAIPSEQTPISQQALAERIIADALPVRFQIQSHKIIWPVDARGV